jgi:hypothetical protein
MQDLSAYKGTLPYASELLGIYQPLLGWKSRLTARRVERSLQDTYLKIATKVLNRVRPTVVVRAEGERELLAGRFLNTQFRVEGLKPADLEGGLQPVMSPAIDSGVARLLRERLGDQPPRNWAEAVTEDRMSALLERLQHVLTEPEELANRPDLANYVDAFVTALGQVDRATALRVFFEKESRIAGYLLFLAQHSPAQLTPLFFRGPRADALRLTAFADPLLNFGENAYKAVLSPLGVIHLYRQYFFEFDSFLGPPVGHVWLSPGGTVELVEVNTRKVLTERTVSISTETIQRSETERTTQDDIADAIREENRSNMKFGFTNVAQYTTPVFQDTATVSFSLDNAKTSSRETTHQFMRRQSEKLSSEIKRNFKTTFKTSTEVTDTTSKRYVINNTTKRLINYELRRKMRKVGVQVQDIGVQMCWHTFVDDPGYELGIAKFVHMAEPPDMANLAQPEQPVDPTIQQQEVTFPIPFEGLDTDDNDQAYTDGSETEVGAVDETEHIRADFPQAVTFAQPGFTLTDVQLEVVGADARVSRRDLNSEPGSSRGTFTAHLDYVNWKELDQFTVKARLVWSPSEETAEKVKAAYNSKVAEYTAERARRYREAFYKAARERIKLASGIQSRPAEILREEERTVVYRRLIAQLMRVAPTESKHVISELVRSIFDVDKMLYFVAPEWWVPRLHRSTQTLGEEEKPPANAAAAPAAPAPSTAGTAVSKFSQIAIQGQSVLKIKEMIAIAEQAGNVKPKGTPIPASNIVDWGGAREYNRDNYYITEDSVPAKLGSSLGWLLQLDGDNLRNALLNAPWVKAVIPIRIGKEREAINWLRQAHVEGEDGLNAKYVASPNDPPELQSTAGQDVTVEDALLILAGKINTFDQQSRTSVLPNPADPGDPANHYAGSLPTEAVFENGFYPLRGGVKFNQSGTDQVMFSQWMEILPTDQIAALEVEYDPKTLQVKVLDQPERDNGEDDV